MTPASFDGTTGRSRHAGRRTHVLQLLRDAPHPVSVRDVAAAAGIPTATARYHLEAFVDAGLAERTTAPRRGPGRPEVVYTGTLPNQTHERAQAFRVLAASLTSVLDLQGSAGEHLAYRVGQDWADRVLMGRPARDGAPLAEVVPELVAKLDSLWFAPEMVDSAPAARTDADRAPATYTADGSCGDDVAAVTMVVNNCPLANPDGTCCTATCHLEAGFIDGLLDRLGGGDHHITQIVPRHPADHCCTMRIGVRPEALAGDAPDARQRTAEQSAPGARHDPLRPGQGFAQLRASAPERA